MSYQSEAPVRSGRYEVRVASPDDAPRIEALFAEQGFPGDIAVHFRRRPSVADSLAADGDDVVIAVCHDTATGALAGMGACVLREEWFNGSRRLGAYLTALKRARGDPGAIRALPLAYAWLGRTVFARTAEKERPFFYTTILSGNDPAMRLLGRPHGGLPAYSPLGVYTVFILGTRRREPRLPAGLSFRPGWDAAVARFYEDQLPRYNCAPPTERLAAIPGAETYSLRDGTKVVAAGSVWDQADTKQYLVTGYAPRYRAARHLPLRALGYPALPAPGLPARYSTLTGVVVADSHTGIAADFLRLLAGRRPGLDFAIFGAMEGHPLAAPAARLRHVSYTSQLYAVGYPGNPAPDGRPIMLEAGLL